ncbi:MAG: L-threonylcarbamoyladenylate synthase [Chitinophagaceae bacterium]|jgi:L-threonylcarbamoyladenylate synthase|nr:L-threonylcarbamoyladenylate synthase [Chitinophagaceae bacterium]
METVIGKSIKQAAYFLNQQQLVAIPTETVYGLAGNAFNEEAVQQIYTVKQRPLYNPLIVHIAHLEYLTTIAKNIPSNAYKLFEAFSPGPLTLLLPKKAIVPNIVTAGLPHVAVRIPKHTLTLKLLQQLSFPLAAPSANLFGYISPTQPQHVLKQLNHKIPYILDGGACKSGIESTVVGFQKNIPVIYRLGSISKEAIEAITGQCLLKNEINHVAPVSPGMIQYHYSPNTPLILTQSVEATVQSLKKKKIGLISFSNQYNAIPVHRTIILSKKKNVVEAAKNIYAALHTMDDFKLDVIIVEQLPNKGIGIAVNEKLEKAAAKTKI